MIVTSMSEAPRFRLAKVAPKGTRLEAEIGLTPSVRARFNASNAAPVDPTRAKWVEEFFRYDGPEASRVPPCIRQDKDH